MSQNFKYPDQIVQNNNISILPLQQDLLLKQPDPAYSYCWELQEEPILTPPVLESEKEMSMSINSNLAEEDNTHQSFISEVENPSALVNNINEVSENELPQVPSYDISSPSLESEILDSNNNNESVPSFMNSPEIQESKSIPTIESIHNTNEKITKSDESLADTSFSKIEKLEIKSTHENKGQNQAGPSSELHNLSKESRPPKKIKDFYSWLYSLHDTSTSSDAKKANVKKEKKEKSLTKVQDSTKPKIKVSKKIKSIDSNKSDNKKIKSNQKELFDYIESSTIKKEEVISETLAAILAQQGHKEDAIIMYEKLKLKFPKKQKSLQKKIDQLRSLKK